MVATRKKTWSQTITPLLKKFKARTDKVLNAYRKEVKAKKLNTINSQNELWRKKYKTQFDAIDRLHDKEYSRVWNSFHKRSKK